MNIPNLRPPKLPPEEHLRRLHLQKEGLKSWEPGPDKDYMSIWIEARIHEAKLAIEVVKGTRS